MVTVADTLDLGWAVAKSLYPPGNAPSTLRRMEHYATGFAAGIEGRRYSGSREMDRVSGHADGRAAASVIQVVNRGTDRVPSALGVALAGELFPAGADPKRLEKFVYGFVSGYEGRRPPARTLDSGPEKLIGHRAGRVALAVLSAVGA